jgi:hypothetical protein
LVRVLAAMCRQNGGELRIKGELVDAINEPTTLLKDWDSKSQELVLRTHMGSFGEVFRVVPEKQPTKEVILTDPMQKQAELPLTPKVIGSTLDDERIAALERKATKVRVARLVREEMAASRRNQPEA